MIWECEHCEQLWECIQIMYNVTVSYDLIILGENKNVKLNNLISVLRVKEKMKYGENLFVGLQSWC